MPIKVHLAPSSDPCLLLRGFVLRLIMEGGHACVGWCSRPNGLDMPARSQKLGGILSAGTGRALRNSPAEGKADQGPTRLTAEQRHCLEYKDY